MGKKRKRRRVVRRKRKAAPPPVEDVKEPEDIEEEDIEDEDDDELEPEPEPEKVTRRKKKVKKKSRETEEVEEEVVDTEEKTAPKRTVVKKEDKDAERGKVEFKSEPFIDFLNVLMKEGKAVLIVPNDDGSAYTMQLADKVPAEMAGGKKLKGMEYWREVANPEYIEWITEWKKLSVEEQVKVVNKLKIDPEDYEHETDKIMRMRLTSAMVRAKKIEKYKPKYRTRPARAAIRGK